jgi:hypothetical protein
MIFIIMTLIGWRDDKREAEMKSEESIRGIARSFDRRAIDPWIARAVYEEIVDLYPVRSRDAFQEGFMVDEEDLEESLKAIAQRVGRNLDDAEANPVGNKVVTVGDLVLFLQVQPKIATDSAHRYS